MAFLFEINRIELFKYLSFSKVLSHQKCYYSYLTFRRKVLLPLPYFSSKSKFSKTEVKPNFSGVQIPILNCPSPKKTQIRRYEENLSE